MTDKIYSLLENLPHWWNTEETSNTYNFLLSFAQEFDDFDTEISNMHDEIFINTASGKYLNELGRIFRLARTAGESDEEFRARILSYWPGFSGGGTIPSIAETFNRILGINTDDVTVYESYPLKFNAEINSTDSDYSAGIIATANDVIWQTKAAGIYPFFTFTLNFGDEEGTGSYQDGLVFSEYLDIILKGLEGIFTADISVADGWDLAG